jgi:hypothetical protein
LRGSIQRDGAEKRKKEHEVAAMRNDIYVVIRDAFRAARRQSQDYAQKQNDAMKRRKPAPRARISRLHPEGR